MAEFSVVGKNIPRKTDPLRATGGAKYTGDIYLPGMLYGKMLRSPYPHARILNIKTDKAKSLPGVKCVVTGKDTLGINYGFVCSIPPLMDQYGIAVDKVRFIGDVVAAVAAIDEDTAAEALDLIDVGYEVLPAVFDPLEAMRPGAPQIHEHVEKNISVEINREFGEVDRAFNEADYIREDEFTTQSVDHCPMETNTIIASYDLSGKLTVWVSLQSPYYLQKLLERTLGLKDTQVRVITPYVGGGFGEKGEMHPIHFCAALMSMKTAMAVKMSHTREEEFAMSTKRHPSRIYIKSGVKKDGTVNVVQVKAVLDTGAYNSIGPITINLIDGAPFATYRIPNVRYNGQLVYTNNQVSGAMRGHAHIQMQFALDSQFDLIAEQLGIDPIEIRLKNATQAGDVTANGGKIGSCGFTDCLQQVRDLTGWKNRWGSLDRGKGLGIGTMCFISGASANFFGATPAHSAANVRLMEDGTVTLLTGVSDVGQGCEDTLAQIAAEELGILYQDIRVVAADTEITPVDYGSYSSRVTMMGGNAALRAAADAKRQLFEVVADKLEANVEDLEAKERMVYVKGSPEKGMSFKEAVLAHQAAKEGQPLIGQGTYNPPAFDMMTGEGNVTPAFAFGANIAELEVDEETGIVRVLNFTTTHDGGRAISPMRAAGQLEGAIQMGLGQALSEELLYDKGQNLNPSFLNSGFLTAMDMPKITAHHVEHPDPAGPYGAKEAGEGSTVPICGAIANAIYDAIGVRIKDLPARPENILKALKRM